MTGTIFNLRLNLGYVFVRGEDGLSRFLHASNVIPPEAFDRLYEGQRVEFTSVNDDRGRGNGFRAVDARPQFTKSVD